DGEIFDQDKVKQLASIPSKEVLIAKLLGSIKSPVSNFAYLINAIKEKKEAESAE
ncbi:MAG: 50S ribosomal protein L10, partial [Sarcina sp.]